MPSDSNELAYSAHEKEHDTIYRDLIPVQHLDTLYDDYEISSVTSNIVPIPKLTRFDHAHNLQASEHNIPESMLRALHRVCSEYNSRTLEWKNDTHNAT